MPKKPITVGELSFSSRGDANEHYRKLLYKYSIGTTIPEPDSTELLWLFERHPEYLTKAGCGVVGFTIGSAIFGTLCFEVIRGDNTKTDFSAKSCLDGKHAPLLSQCVDAMRAEVSDQIIQKKWQAFREGTDAQGLYHCPISGEPTLIDDTSVYYMPPQTFRGLALSFLKENSLEPTDEFLSPSKDNQYLPGMRNRELAVLWRDWHNKNAKITAVSRRR